MAKDGIAYDPTLSVLEGMRDLSAGRTDLLRRSLVQQAVSQKLLTGTAAAIKEGKMTNPERAGGIDGAIRIAQNNLRRAWQAGVPLVTGSDAGNMLVFHGPTVHRELQLWVEAGIPPAIALQAATFNAAKLLRADSRIGLVSTGSRRQPARRRRRPDARHQRHRTDFNGRAEGRAGPPRRPVRRGEEPAGVIRSG